MRLFRFCKVFRPLARKLGLSRGQWGEKYKTLYKNREKGAIAEEKFNELLGSDATHFELQTGNGKRYIDHVLNGIAKEIKSGKVSWSDYRDQVLMALF